MNGGDASHNPRKPSAPARASATCLREAAFLGFLSFLPILSVLAPRSLAFTAGLAGILGLLAWVRTSSVKKRNLIPFLSLASAWVVFAGLSALWSADPPQSLDRVKNLGLVLLPGALFLSVMATFQEAVSERFLILFAAGLGVAMVLVGIELWAGFPIWHLTHGLAFDQPVPSESVMNRSVIVLVMLFSPIAGMLSGRGRLVLLALFLPVLLTTESQSAQIGLAVGLLTALLPAAVYKSSKAWAGLGLAIAAYMAFFPWLVSALFQTLAPLVDANPFLGRGGAYGADRLEIWHFVAQKAMESPFYGHGIEATKELTFDTQALYHTSAHVLHPHNFLLQLWIEFGAIGVTLVFVMIAILLKTMFERLSVLQNRIALPTFMTAFSIASTSYGLWQSWWLGLLLLSAGLVFFAVKRPFSSFS
ncbi:MAG: O-antigen ligase family protein [Alphaproteobacteria bacterium]|nr:O-antigen ligase family protein [Alphaproteobacteria bacterium]